MPIDETRVWRYNAPGYLLSGILADRLGKSILSAFVRVSPRPISTSHSGVTVDIVTAIHSLVRFVLLLVAVAGIVLTVVNLATRRAPASMDRGIASGFVGLYDLQVLLGLLIILLGGLSNALHPIVMFLGALAAHGLQVMSRTAEGNRLQMLRLALYVVPLAIILIGLAVINHLPV